MKTVYAATVAMRAAWAVLRQNRWRSLLTLAICGLGTSGVMVAGLLGEANLAEMQARLQTLGGGLLVVSPNKLPPYPGRVRQLEHFITLVPEDGKALSRLVPELTTVVPVVARDTVVRAGNAASRVRLIGTDPDYMRVRSFKLRKGRFFCSADGNQRVIVLGHSVAEEVFPFGARAGEMVTLRSAPFVVVGILEPQGINFAGEDEDHQVFIPLEAYQRRIANRPWLTFLYLQLSATQDPTGVVNMVGAVLRQRHGRFRDQVDDVVVRDLADLAAQQAGLLTTAVWAVSATSGLLLATGVCGIGALMLLVVRQRRAEIGLRRALGATPFDIALQFFLEGVIVAATGVLAGLALGVVGASLIMRFLAMPVDLDPRLPAIAAAVSLAASAVACLYPSLAAAWMEPATALRP